MEAPIDDFALAEVASGSTRELLYPRSMRHACGRRRERGDHDGPRLVRKIEDREGNLVYSSEPVGLANPVSGETAKKMKVLMDETVVTGTARTAFSRYLNKSVFKELELGAKTGSINDPFDQRRWTGLPPMPSRFRGRGCNLPLGAGRSWGEARDSAQEIARHVVENYFGS